MANDHEPKQPKSDAEQRLPEEWLELVFPVVKSLPHGAVKRHGGQAWHAHAAAANLHGWKRDAYHARTEDRLRLTRADYEAALKAAGTLGGTAQRTKTSRNGVRVTSTYRVPAPHPPALSQYAKNAI